MYWKSDKIISLRLQQLYSPQSFHLYSWFRHNFYLKSKKLFHFVSNYVIILIDSVVFLIPPTICIWWMKTLFPSLLRIIRKNPFFSIPDSAISIYLKSDKLFHFDSTCKFFQIVSLVFLIQPQYLFEDWQAFSLRLQLLIILIVSLVFLNQLQYSFEELQAFSLPLQLFIILNRYTCIQDSATIFSLKSDKLFHLVPQTIYSFKSFHLYSLFSHNIYLKSDKIFHFVSN